MKSWLKGGRSASESGKTRRRRLALLIGAPAGLFVCGLAMVGVASAGSKAKPAVTVGVITQGALDPTLGFAYPVSWTMAFAQMVHQNPDGSYSPDLATSWGFVNSPKNGTAGHTYQFTLRHDAHYSTGAQVTAASVAKWDNYVSKKGGFFVPDPTFSAKGKWELVVHLKQGQPNLISFFSDQAGGGPEAPSCFSTAAKEKQLSDKTCGAGPYVLNPSKTVAGDHYTYYPNKHYYDPSRQYWSQVTEKIVIVPTTMLDGVRAGNIQIAMGDPTTIGAAKADGLGVTAATEESLEYFMDTRGKDVPALANLKVRQALNYAINRKALAKAFGGGYGQPTDEGVNPDGYDSNPKWVNYYSYNPAKAKALLAAAGYPNGFTINPVATTGFGGTTGTPMTEAMAQQLAAVGVKLVVKDDPTVSAWAQDSATDPTPMFEINPGWCGSSASWYQAVVLPGGAFNSLGGGINDPIINTDYAKALNSSHPSYWLRRIQDEIIRKAYWLPVINGLNSSNVYYTSPNVTVATAKGRCNGPAFWEWKPKS